MYSYIQDFIEPNPEDITVYTYYDRNRNRWDIMLKNRKSKHRRHTVCHTIGEVAQLHSELSDFGVYVKNSYLN
jgi:hypothetical protein